METRTGDRDEEEKDDIESSGEDCLGQDSMEGHCCRPMPPGCLRVERREERLIN